ncbi:ribosome small subunit-dependent GTPase A [Paenibacillus nasutitermitis]|uniref:Small ribosomal subunit biogenesis GTPase RsgA n=1 Tax=Paenibacillus nasutitermitis TaxID=1652958 RepID=A0A917DVN5_9BACL|nr:ribosome small subunit-dependent GTPase A [Paenibacillus nasutitermitis]GGD74945.1 putative ribosome biogenesis GTPase RsgA [Paenibacillus nasutitermitis]
MNLNENEYLQLFGWNESWRTLFLASGYEGLIPARIIAQFANQYRVITSHGECQAAVSGKFMFEAATRSDYPGVGDWTAVQPLPGESRVIIQAVLPRKSMMLRRAAGTIPEEQVIGANIDTLLIVSALNEDFNIRKIERYLIAAWESGAVPVVLLTKADLCAEVQDRIAAVEAAAPGVAVHAVSALQDQGREALSAYLQPGHTAALTGSSGVGKSTLLNWLAGGDLQRVQEIREDDARGRHTTTHRELFPLPCGAVMLDTPGMRELQLWEAGDGRQEAFADIEAAASACRYRDCRHEGEDGCAVKQAIADGGLDPLRLASYRKTGRELRHIARKEQQLSNRNKKSAGKRSDAYYNRNKHKRAED